MILQMNGCSGMRNGEPSTKPSWKEWSLCMLGRALSLGLITLLSFTWPALASAQRTQADGATKTLEQRGLVRFGLVWVSPEEAKLRELLTAVRKQDAELRKVKRQVDQALAENNRQLALVTQARVEADELGRLIDSGTLDVKQINQLTAEHNRRVDYVNSVGPGLFDAGSEVNNLPLARLQQTLLELRNSLVIKLLEIDRVAVEIEGSYAPFSDDGAIEQALAKLGNNNRLGPAKVYNNELKRLARARTSALNGELPVNREDEDYRLWGVLDEQKGLLFTFLPGFKHRLLSTGDAENLGIEVTEDAVEKTVAYSEERQVKGRLVTISRLRLGSQVFDDVEFLVTGAKDADIGSVLGSSAFNGVRTKFEPQKLTLQMAGAEESKSPADGQRDDSAANSGVIFFPRQ
ncbi:MAG: hypothetical protein MPJ50_13750 [Pirellulales bacterium]|nr:hypothetical protein [Pirellulales bacterium]